MLSLSLLHLFSFLIVNMLSEDMDPIAFFDHLAATSQSSNEDEMRLSYRGVAEKRQHDHSKQLLNSRSLETIKPVRKEEEEEEEEGEEEEQEKDPIAPSVSFQQHPRSFASKWLELVSSYRLEKEGKSILLLLNQPLMMATT